MSETLAACCLGTMVQSQSFPALFMHGAIVRNPDAVSSVLHMSCSGLRATLAVGGDGTSASHLEIRIVDGKLIRLHSPVSRKPTQTEMAL